MTREEVISCLYDRFIRPTEQKKKSYIGVEIEMPIVNLQNKAVDFAVVHKLTAAIPSSAATPSLQAPFPRAQGSA